MLRPAARTLPSRALVAATQAPGRARALAAVANQAPGRALKDRPPSASTSEPVLHVALFQPQIPPNTGAIGRSVLATRCRLHLIHPLGFRMDDKTLKRAGLDYWPLVDCVEHLSWDDYLANAAPRRLFLFTTKGSKPHWEARFERGDHLLFGTEHAGAPEWLHAHVDERHGDGFRVRLPISPEVGGRSLNLSCSATAAVYEGIRQISVAEGALPWEPSGG